MVLKKIILLALLLIGSTACHQEPVYKDLNGRTIRLSDFHNKWLVINYWAHWCKPCYEEVPELNAFYLQHAKNAVIVGVSYDKASPEKLKQWVKKLGIKFAVLTEDPAQQLGIGDIPGLPTSVIIDPKGHVKKLLYGPQTASSILKEVQSSSKK